MVMHQKAMRLPRPGYEAAVVGMFKGWLAYAEAHAGSCGSIIGSDYVLGPEWEAIGQALLGLLNGETGRLDCGTLDREIRAALKEQGFDT
jgi:hypothetical protein